MILKIPVWVIFFFCSVLTMGQNPYFHAIDRTLGLPSNAVYDIFQDNKGFMWFATNKGLCRFDGIKFVSYISDNQTSAAGSSISEDEFGRIWYCNFDGYLYYVENGVLQKFPQPETIGYFQYGIIKNHLYLIQKNKILIYDLKDFSIVSTHEIQGKTVYFTFSDKDNFYVLTDFLYVFSDKKLLEKHEIPENIKENFASAIVQQSQNGLVILSKSSDKYYLFQNGTFIQKNLSSTMSFIQNAVFLDNQFWICTTNGIFQNGLLKNPKTYFSDYNISFIFKDKDENYWISTLNKGLILVEDFSSEFISMDSRPILLDFLKNDLLVSTEKDALYLFSMKDKSLSKFYQGNSNHAISQLYTDNENQKIYFTSSSFKMMNFEKKVENEIQISVKDVNKIDQKYFSFAASRVNGIFSVHSSEKQDWDDIYYSFHDSQAELKGVDFLENINGKSTIYNPENSTIYYATNVGLFAQYLVKNQELLFDENHLYISKLGVYEGVVFALSTNGKIYTISKENEISVFELPNNHENKKIYKLKIIGNLLFLFGEKTLLEYDFISQRFRKIILGANDLDVMDLVLYQDKIIFTTSKGLLIYNQKKQSKTIVPKLVINQVLVNNQAFFDKDLKKLKNQQNNINIQFSALSFMPNVKVEVYYRINEKEWELLDDENRNLMLNSLSFGKYKVDFKAKIDEYFSDIQSVSFEIGKPFWLQIWFIAFFIIFVLFIVYLVVQFQIQKERKQSQLIVDRVNLENNLNQSKLKAIKSQMNPHFFYNALNTIQSYILSNEKKTAVNYLSKFSLLTRTILEMTEKDWVTISEEIKTISLYLEIERARFNDDFEYEIRFDENTDFENLKIPSMLLQPCIENAIKHGLLHKKGTKKLLISFENKKGNTIISIDDNGIGRKKSAELNAIKTGKHQSFATEAMQRRIDLLNENKTKKITLTYIDKMNEAGNSLGTKVNINIPDLFEG